MRLACFMGLYKSHLGKKFTVCHDRVSPEKTPQPIDMPFEMYTLVAPMYHALDMVHMGRLQANNIERSGS